MSPKATTFINRLHNPHLSNKIPPRVSQMRVLIWQPSLQKVIVTINHPNPKTG